MRCRNTGRRRCPRPAIKYRGLVSLGDFLIDDVDNFLIDELGNFLIS